MLPFYGRYGVVALFFFKFFLHHLLDFVPLDLQIEYIYILPSKYYRVNYTVIKSKISFANMMSRPPKNARKPLARWLESWLCTARPICTMP